MKNGNSYTKILKEKYPNEKFVIICADIEDQITDLKLKKKRLYEKYRSRKNWFKSIDNNWL